MGPDRQVPPRGTVGLLLDPQFGPYFFGKLLSTVGVWTFSMVAAVIVWDLTHSAFAVGAVSAAMFLPQLVLAPLSGAQADRREPKTQLAVGRFIVMLGSGGLALAIATQGVAGLPGAWVIIAVGALVGVGFVVGGPAQYSLLPSLVREPEIARAVALNSIPPTLARAGGPVIGTLILAAWGPAWAFTVTSLSNLVFGLVIVALPLHGRVERAAEGSHTVRKGLAFLREERSVAYLLIAMLAVGVGSDPVITLTPALSAAFGHGEGLVGALAGAFGGGASAAYFAVSPLRRRFGDAAVTNGGLVALAGGLTLTGIPGGAIPAVVALAIAGVGFSWTLTGATTQIYSHIPESYRGRVMALWAMAFAGSRPLSALFTGLLADLASPRVAFIGVGLVVGIFGTWAHVGTRRDSAA